MLASCRYLLSIALRNAKGSVPAAEGDKPSLLIFFSIAGRLASEPHVVVVALEPRILSGPGKEG